MYGVKAKSLLLALPGFDVSVQLLQDATHDVLECGIAFVLKRGLKGLISIYLKYREIVNIILADTIPEDALAFLEVLID